MTDDLADDSTDLANLNAENDERLKRALQQGFPLQPGMFESLRIICHLETLLSVIDKLEESNLEYANRASTILDQIEQVIRQRALTGGIQASDVDKIVSMGRNSAR
jgi:hypothetical protein